MALSGRQSPKSGKLVSSDSRGEVGTIRDKTKNNTGKKIKPSLLKEIRKEVARAIG